MQNELARMVDQQARKVDPSDFYAIQPKDEQSRAEWEAKGRRPGR